jgi:hypothetical protein
MIPVNFLMLLADSLAQFHEGQVFLLGLIVGLLMLNQKPHR